VILHSISFLFNLFVIKKFYQIFFINIMNPSVMILHILSRTEYFVDCIQSTTYQTNYKPDYQD